MGYRSDSIAISRDMGPLSFQGDSGPCSLGPKQLIAHTVSERVWCSGILYCLRLGKSRWGLSNGGLRPLSAICAQSSTIVHFCGLFGSLSKGDFRRKMMTIVGNRGQLWTSALSPHLESPHLDFPDVSGRRVRKLGLLFRRAVLNLHTVTFEAVRTAVIPSTDSGTQYDAEKYLP